ncbi:hypothetical protein OG21DRAFT_1485264 [Imleria badia]|nr:hypothetical protein OG21DRAFT_1485264 [Imleria badia]
MFPGAVGSNVYPNDEDLELNPPTKRQVRGFLLMECLAPIPRSSHEWMVWVWGLIRVLLVPGRYRALLDWVMAAPRHDSPVAWIGEFTNQVTMTNIAAYLATNGITVHDADDAVWCTRSIAQEMLNHINESGGLDNPSTAAHYGPTQQDRQIPCTDNSLNRTREWYKSKA